ncbi:MAG: sigma-70 family RNA polymerase sigma factor [Bacillaceae bacterium]|nr:sigma-70 family RNA polymerase sigma factor [Bacillaceae bacterium]
MKNDELIHTCIDRYYDDVLNYMFLQTQSYHDARDLTQETYYQILKSSDSFNHHSSLKTWVFRIAKNVVYQSLRKKYKLKKIVSKTKDQFKLESRKHFVENKDVFLLLNHLPKEDQQLLILKYYLGFSYREIGEITGLSESNIGVKLNRLIKKLNDEHQRGDTRE